jgi:hypothetical protein
MIEMRVKFLISFLDGACSGSVMGSWDFRCNVIIMVKRGGATGDEMGR